MEVLSNRALSKIVSKVKVGQDAQFRLTARWYSSVLEDVEESRWVAVQWSD